MKFIPALTEADQIALEAVQHKAKTHRQRQRAHAVLLSAKGFTLEQLADIFSVDCDTVSGWLNLWQERRLDGLADAPKSGRFRKIDYSLMPSVRPKFRSKTYNILQTCKKSKIYIPKLFISSPAFFGAPILLLDRTPTIRRDPSEVKE